jgi:hypothetical protein
MFVNEPSLTEGVATVSDRNTQYFKITSRSIALHFAIAIALAGFYPYCYAKSAIFGKGDRAIFNSYAL